jgi:hypothetical protein
LEGLGGKGEEVKKKKFKGRRKRRAGLAREIETQRGRLGSHARVWWEMMASVGILHLDKAIDGGIRGHGDLID